MAESGDEFGEGLTKHLRITGQITSEQCATDNGQGECGHLLDHVYLLAITPCGLMLKGQSHHLRGVVGYPVAMEGGLGQAALSKVELTLTCE